eukprot:TRINITY_DN22691_c0_g1_i1.p1 TRINITY_DN22691_c0_g1~~TRINITY_DN22691_c0_g1_i1.p1  ORF type:complete len:793 (-),score=379.60 TRINITY_DN22691_c0_g1_i1:84-2462(-)
MAAVRSGRRPTGATTSSPARSAAPTQPALVPAVTPEWFEGKFDEVNFIQRLTRKIVVEQKSQDKNKGEFQPGPFIEAFSFTLDSINKLQDKTARKLANASEETGAARSELTQSLVGLRDQFEKNFKHFHKLDKRINAVGNTAIRIGDRLEAVDSQRLRALESKEIMECLLALNAETTPTEPDKLLDWFFAFKMDTASYKIKKRIGDFKTKGVYHFTFDKPDAIHRYERVILAKKLWSIAQDLNIERLLKAKQNMEILVDRLENYLLDKFDDASAGRDYVTMKECAMMLFEFNGGDSCIKHYIASLDMFLDPKKIQEDVDLALSSEGVSSDSFSSYDDSRLVDDPRLVGFFDGIKKTMGDEYAVITKVFPQPVGIMKELVQRIFEQRISKFMETVFVQIKTPLVFLRTLATAYAKCNEVVEALQGLLMSDVNYELLVDSIFSAYRSSYMEREVSSLSSIFELLLAEEAGERLKQEKRAAQDVDVDQGTLLSLEMALNFVHASEEASKRCVLVSWKSDAATNLVQLFVQLLKYLGYQYVNEVLGKAVHQLPVACIKSYAKTLKVVDGFFRLIYVVNQIVMFIQKHFHLDILPNISSANELTSCELAKDKLLLELEQKVAHGLQKSLSATMSAIEKILYQKQKKADFRLAENDTSVPFNSVTEACAETIALMRQVHAFMSATLDGQNLEVVTNDFGRRASKVLLEHFKGFTISQGAGGLQLLRDLTAYKECAKQLFTNDGVLDEFETLRELANIHLVAPDHLKVVLSESRLAKMDRNEVMQFIRLRSDYNRNWKF